MSLLLDALRSTVPEPDAGSGVALEAVELQEEPLDAAATLALLASKPVAQTALSLVPTIGLSPAEATYPPAVAGPAAVGLEPAGPEPVVEMARIAPLPPRPPAAASGRAEAAAPAAAAATNPIPRAAATAPSTAPRAKKYALLLGALAALGCIGFLGKSLWWPAPTVVNYPRPGDSQTAPAVNDQPATPSIAAVQVSSTRPAHQFAYAGNAPEIDLRATDLPAKVARRAQAIAPAGAGSSTGAASVASPSRGAAPFVANAALSVTRSDAPSPIDRRVQAGYLALGAGNVANAHAEYLAALELDPNNVDALMGAATAAARDGRPKAAAAAYGRVLMLEPGNPDATAALATLGADGATGENTESRIKILIASDDGGRPALHAALAGVFAADSRWTEAAQEYFIALAKDPGNPDLAFNVAASLDQNRNVDTALIYYGQALAFARQRPTQLDLHALEQRISQLKARAGHAAGTSERP